MLHTRIDLNADLGEGHGDDAAIFPYISSANIACGGHAGSSRTMDLALAAAAHHDVAVGAHISYEDPAHFGRRDIEVSRTTLQAQLTQQISKLQHLASRFGLTVRYVKPHGALYHRIATDLDQAHAFVDAVRACDPALELLVPFSTMLRTIAAPQHCRYEFFADRSYHLDARLVDRDVPGSVLVDAEVACNRALHWLHTGDVRSIEGKSLRLDAQSICIHGDSPNAVAMAAALHSQILDAGIRIAHWANQ